MRQRRELLRLERVDDVVALALRGQQADRGEQAQLFRRSRVREPGERSELLRAARLLREELEDPQPRRIAERFQQPDELGRRRALQARDEVRRAVHDGERPRRVAVHAHVRPDVDARHEQQRVLRADRDPVLVRDVEPEAARSGLHAQLRREREEERAHAVARDQPSRALDALREVRLESRPLLRERVLPVRLEQRDEPVDQGLWIVEQKGRRAPGRRSVHAGAPQRLRAHLG